MLLVTLFRNDAAAVIHDGWWSLKYVGVAGLYLGSFFIPNAPVIEYYLIGARYVSVGYLKYQAMHILVLAYVINNALVSRASRPGGSWAKILLVAAFLVLTISNLAWIVIMFVEFGHKGCGGNIAIMCGTLVSGIAMYGLVLVRSRSDASMFTSSLVLTYCLFLQWSAFTSDIKTECNPLSPLSDSGRNFYANTVMMTVLGLFFVFSSLLTVAAITKKEGDDKQMATELNSAMLSAELSDRNTINDVELNDGAVKTAAEMHVFPVTATTIYF